MEELKQENQTFKDVEFTIIDEIKQPDISDQYDYFLVPAYYVNDKKLHEGIASKETVKSVFEKAREAQSKAQL